MSTIKDQNGPIVQRISLDITPPSLKNNTADIDRLKKVLWDKTGVEPQIDFTDFNRISKDLWQYGFQARCLIDVSQEKPRLIALEPMDAPPALLGLAVDLGTTHIHCHLMDLEAGTVIGKQTILNPQIEHGADVLTRIHFATSGGFRELQRLAAQAISQVAAELCKKNNVLLKDVHAAALAGNTIMSHLFLGLWPDHIRREPYIPVANRFPTIRADAVGLDVNPAAPVLVFPNVGSYFGGDLISGILASGLDRAEGVNMLVDVGTNAEVVLGGGDFLVACAGADGPALESGIARMGMVAGPGAVERVKIDPETLVAQVETIGQDEGEKPIGICGSGFIDLAAQLYLRRIMDQRGEYRLVADHPVMVEIDERPAYVVVPADQTATGLPITVSQMELDSLLRSKAAMYSILRTITLEVGVGFEDLKKFFVAGAFGQYIDPESAIQLGMLPDLDRSVYFSLGNTAVRGAEMVLSNLADWRRAMDIAGKITYIELNVNQAFMNRFSAARFIPHTDRSRFPSVPVFDD